MIVGFFYITNISLPRTVAIPLASLLGVKDKQQISAPSNPILESYYCSTSKQPTQVCCL